MTEPFIDRDRTHSENCHQWHFECAMLRAEWVPARSLLTGEIEKWWHPRNLEVTDDEARAHWREHGSSPPPF